MNFFNFQKNLNIFFYFIWKYEVKKFQKMTQIILKILYYFSKKLLSNKYQNKFTKKINQNIKINEPSIYDQKKGICIGLTKYWMDFFAFGYISFLTFIIIPIVSYFLGSIKDYVIITIVTINTFIAFHYIDKSIIKNYKYLVFFKKFINNNSDWHKKWKFRTILFCLGGTLLIFASGFLMVALLILFNIE